MNNDQQKQGFTLIEALVFLFIFSVVVTTFYSVFSLGTKYIIESKNKLGALAVANEKMEIVRNLKYDDIGLVTGIPEGNIPEEEDVAVETKTYNVKTIVQYVDDAFDGVFPDDVIPNDYKRVKVTVSWGQSGSVSSSVYLVSQFPPPGLETSSGGGILAINVTDGEGVGVSQARVHIVNNDVSPAVDISQNTDNSGNLMFPGAKESQQGYELTVSKDGYETASTVDPNAVDYLPNDPHASVVTGALNTAVVIIDKLSDLKIKTVDYLGSSLADVSFHIKGGRELGTRSTVVPPEIVYTLDSNESTGSEGEKNFNDHSPGRQFFLTNIGSVSGHTLIGASPISGFDAVPATYKFSLLADESKTIEIKFAKNDTDSLLVRVLNNSNNLPVNDAQVKLTNGSGYDATIVTSFDGVVFFPENSNPFIPGTYNLEITSSGFGTYSSSVDIDKLTIKEVKLNPE